ncbi:A-kinase anchor protein 17A isoform X3 [Solea solea]|uniref:A-kinase anchor protein 17A isoform X3 n=1 Tax=Solea solea TaxID=90069 RepID=UPI0027299150|nr:A-kinase anchor protein 17A isoform X3 [Solea solea]
MRAIWLKCSTSVERPHPSATMTTIVHDTSEAVCLSTEFNLYLKPIAKVTVSVALPQLKLPGKSISNWEVMERIKAMVAPEQFSALRISKSTMDFIRFEGEVENKTIVKSLLGRLDGKSIKLSGFTDVLKVRAVENKVDFPTRHDWDSFFRDAKDMNETLPGERPDTIHLEGLPCRWFSQKNSPFPDRPSEKVLTDVFETFGKVRNVDIPMLDPYREEMLDKNFNTFSFGGHLNFEAYVQYQEYCGFTKAMDTMRGMKLMLKGEDGKAVACNIKVTFDTSKHLSELALKRRTLERMKLQELERQREEQKRQAKEEEERRKEMERKQKELEEEEKEKKKEERLRRREQKLREKEQRKTLKKALKQQQQEKERAERKEQERQEQARQKEELARLQQLEACRRKQEEELRRVEVEKDRSLELQRKEKELRERLLCNLMKKGNDSSTKPPGTHEKVPTKEASVPGGTDEMLEVLGRLNGVKAAESKEKRMSKSGAQAHASGKNRAMEERRGVEERKTGREGRREEAARSRYSRERARVQERSYKERSSHSKERRRRSHSYSRRRRSSSRHRRDSSHHRRSSSHHGSRRHNRCSRSTSSSRSRSSSGRSYSRGRSHRHSHRRHSRASSRGSNTSRERKSHSHYNRSYRRHSDSRDRSHSRRR